MSTFAPEFSQFWLAARTGSQREDRSETGEAESRQQEAALEELAERVNAARSVI